ncbi:MAG: hypothetical protein EOO43_17485 [Flavobacterium sp.]|nr:MAG: hypothetical protein EOO43_17485 [Flavobacterium sp.]
MFGNEIEDYYFNQGYMKGKGMDFHSSSHLRPTDETQNSTGVVQNEQTSAMQHIVDHRKIFMPFGCTVK